MVSYLAHDKSSGLVFSGGFHQVAKWSQQRIELKSPKAVIAIIKCRPSENGRVVAEYSIQGVHFIENGRTIPNRDIIKFSRLAGHG